MHPVRTMQFRLSAQRDPARYYHEDRLDGAPPTFKSAAINVRGFPEVRFSLQFYVEDCTGCGLCIEACPAVDPRDSQRRAINLAGKAALIGTRTNQHPVL